jgi:pilus assembly protein FimV
MALGLGEIEVESSLASPFLARVRLDNRNSDVFLDSSQVRIKLESGLSGDEASRVAPRLRYRFEKLNTRMPELVLYTQRPVMNPLFIIKVTVEWDEGTLLRAYDVIVDPPGYDLGEPGTEWNPPMLWPSRPTGRRQTAVLSGGSRVGSERMSQT